MRHAKAQELLVKPSYASAATYYSHVTASYLRYAGESYGWHHGIWDAGVTTLTEALLQSNRRLLRALRITPDTWILDVGCGVGGFAVWAAVTFGCRVTGITVCSDHIGPAQQLARRHGVSGLCDFLLMDLSCLAFAESSFDVVINQESLCHAMDKRQYLGEVLRILRPGGIWRAVAFSIQDAPLDGPDEALYQTVREGFQIPSLLPAREIRLLLEDAGYVHCEVEELTERVVPTARHIVRRCAMSLALGVLGLDGLFVPRDPIRRASYRGHFRAGIAYGRGLLAGHFRHNLYSAYKRGMTHQTVMSPQSVEHVHRQGSRGMFCDDVVVGSSCQSVSHSQIREIGL